MYNQYRKDYIPWEIPTLEQGKSEGEGPAETERYGLIMSPIPSPPCAVHGGGSRRISSEVEPGKEWEEMVFFLLLLFFSSYCFTLLSSSNKLIFPKPCLFSP